MSGRRQRLVSPPRGQHRAPPRRNADDLRGLGKLAVDGVTGATDLVEAMHAAITYLPSAIGRTAPEATTGVPGFVYRNIRSVARIVGEGVDRTLSALGPALGEGGLSLQREAALAIANGVLGDHLEASGNPLAITMQFRLEGVAVGTTAGALSTRFPHAGGKLLVQVHGLCMNDLQWKLDGHDHGHALALDLGYTRLHLHYNSGRHVSANGADFANLLDELVDAWPVPVEEVVLLCHSMGGLVARSALDHAASSGLGWTRLPTRVVFLGTPHHGAPLERAGNWIDTLVGLTPYSAPLVRLGKLRSAGIQDLRHGNLRKPQGPDGKGDAAHDRQEPMPLPAHVEAYAIAASTARRPAAGSSKAARGDGLVPIASALGQHRDSAFDLRIPRKRRWVGYGIGHLEMLGDTGVYQRLHRWLRLPADPARP